MSCATAERKVEGQILAALLFAKLLEQCLGVLQIGGVEAFREPVVDFGEHRASFISLALLVEQSREARGGSQFR